MRRTRRVLEKIAEETYPAPQTFAPKAPEFNVDQQSIPAKTTGPAFPGAAQLYLRLRKKRG